MANEYSLSHEEVAAIGGLLNNNVAELTGIDRLDSRGALADLIAHLKSTDGPDSAAALAAIGQNVDACNKMQDAFIQHGSDVANNTGAFGSTHSENDAAGASSVNSVQT